MHRSWHNICVFQLPLSQNDVHLFLLLQQPDMLRLYKYNIHSNPPRDVERQLISRCLNSVQYHLENPPREAKTCSIISSSRDNVQYHQTSRGINMHTIFNVMLNILRCRDNPHYHRDVYYHISSISRDAKIVKRLEIEIRDRCVQITHQTSLEMPR